MIRKNGFDFENQLKNLYLQPQIINIPDDINPDMPRIIFTSKHGHSQIIISQVNFVFNVNYSDDWQLDISKGREYLVDKISILFDLLEIIEEKSPFFCGLSTLVQIPAQEEDKKVISHIYNLFSSDGNIFSSDIYEFQLKTSKVIEENFFSNISVQNYRNWNIDINSEEISKLSSNTIVESGIQIMGDFNDRYAFNEIESYSSKKDIANKIIELGLNEINNKIKTILRT